MSAPNHESSESIRPQDTPKDENDGSRTPFGGMLMVHSPVDTNQSKNSGQNKTPFWEKAAVVVAFGLLLVTWYQGYQTEKAAEAAKGAAKAAQSAANQGLELNERPWVYVKMPDEITVHGGLPITAPIEFSNVSTTSPTMIRASVYSAAGQNVIEQFRDSLIHPNNNFPDDKRTKKILLSPKGSTAEFPIQSQQGRLTPLESQRIMQGVHDGTIEVAVYGRYFYNDLSTPFAGDKITGAGTTQYYGAFCYYLMRDGSVSACPDKAGAYTNWWGNPRNAPK